MSIATELTKLSNTKLDIKHAIQDKGVIVHDEDTFNTYADKIENIAGYGENIDISKVNYQTGKQNESKLNNGRLLSGFASMSDGYSAFPKDENGNYIIINWSKDFEIGCGFKSTTLSYFTLFGDGLANQFRYTPRIIYHDSLYFCMSMDGNTGNINNLNYAIEINEYYFIKVKFIKSTMEMTVELTKDFETYIKLYDEILTDTQYYNPSAYIAIGGSAQMSTETSNNLYIDTFNTYLKDDTGEIVWGTFTGRFEGDDFPIGRAEEYEIYDYIESDGTGYIETNYHPVTGDVISARYTPTTSTMQYGWIYYAGEGTAYIGITYNPDGVAYWYNGTSGTSYYKSEHFYTDRIYNYDISISPSQNSTFKICYGSAYFKIYQVKINNDYLLPCKRKSDGVFGLYNVNQNKFLIDSNNGTSFTGGNYMYTLAGKIITVNSGTSLETIYFGKESQWLRDSNSTPIEFDIKTVGNRFSEYLSTSDYATFTALKDFDAIITVGAMEDLTHTGVNPPSCSFFVNECTSRHKSGTDRDTGFMGVTAASGQPGTTAFTHFPFSFKAGDTMYWGSINTYGWVVRLGQIDVVEGIDISGYVQPSF